MGEVLRGVRHSRNAAGNGRGVPHCEPGSPLDVDGSEESDWLAHAYSTLFNYTGHPAIVLPVTRDRSGLPIGVQLVAKRWSEARLLGIAKALALASLRGKVVVLAFYPKDRSGGCTHELSKFRDEYAAFFGDGVVVLPISNDSLAEHAGWQRTYTSRSLS